MEVGMGKRQEMRPGAGEVKQAANASGEGDAGTSTQGEGAEGDKGDDSSAEVSIHPLLPCGPYLTYQGGGSDHGSNAGGGGGGGSNALYLVSHEDFCVYGPREAGKEIASTGQDVVSWCTTGVRFLFFPTLSLRYLHPLLLWIPKTPRNTPSSSRWFRADKN